MVKPWAVEKLDQPELPNPWRVGDTLISGGEPVGDEAFAALARLGVRTVISVDGAKPNLALAEKYGMTYVHLPHGYGGIVDQRLKELAKAVDELPGLIYLHCHYGKHRSPTASAAVGVCLGGLTPERGVEFLREAGTDPDYVGLYRTVAEARRLHPKELSSLAVNFEPYQPLPPFAGTMLDIGQVFSRLKKLSKSGWISAAGGIEKARQEALQLRELYVELRRLDEHRAWEGDFGELLAIGTERVRQFEAALEEIRVDEGGARWRQELDGKLRRIDQNCRDCHRRFPEPPEEIR